MNKKEEFRLFVQNKPHLAEYVENGSMSWQKFYELYDLHGENSDVWDKYSSNRSINKISDIVKKVDMDSIKTHINTAQKALGIVQDLTAKNANEAINTIGNLKKGPINPRPLNKFFED